MLKRGTRVLRIELSHGLSVLCSMEQDQMLKLCSLFNTPRTFWSQKFLGARKGPGSAGFWSAIHLAALSYSVCAEKAVQENGGQFCYLVPVDGGLGHAVDSTLQTQAKNRCQWWGDRSGYDLPLPPPRPPGALLSPTPFPPSAPFDQKDKWLSLVHFHGYLTVCLSAQRNYPMGFAIENSIENRFIVIPVSNFSLQMDTNITRLCTPQPNL